MSDKIRKLKEDAARLIAKGRLEDARECYEKVVKLDGRDLTARQKLAEIHGRLGNIDRAVHLYQSVAGSYAADGLLLKAIAVCKIILQLDPSHKETQTILAELSTRRRGGSHEVVEMPKAMSEAITTAKKSAATIRGVSANQIRGVPAHQLRAPTSPGLQVPTVAVIDEAVPPSPSSPPVGQFLATPHTSPAELRAIAGSPPVPPPSPAAAPMPAMAAMASPPLPTDAALDDALPVDVDIDDASAEPIILGSADAAELARAGAPPPTRVPSSMRLSFGLPDFDDMLALSPDDIPDAPAAIIDDTGALDAQPVAPAAMSDDAEAQAEILIDDSGDDDGDVIELMPAQIDVDKVPPIPLFSDLPRDAFMALTERMDLRVASVDEALITEGEGGDSMFIIIQGRVKICRRADDGSELILAELSDGAFFGEMALLSDAPRSASVVCTEETMLFSISRELVADMTAQYPTVGEVMRRFHKNRLITNLLKTSPIFAPFSTSDKKTLIEKFKSRQVDEGTFLITREKPGDGLYVVLSGRCEVIDHDADGRDMVIAELKEGDVFGEMSMLWNKKTCASVRATTTCTVMRLPRAEFNEVIMTHPQILETLSAMSERRALQNERRQAIDVAL
jgi:CRP-like cAMP-binding protein